VFAVRGSDSNQQEVATSGMVRPRSVRRSKVHADTDLSVEGHHLHVVVPYQSATYRVTPTPSIFLDGSAGTGDSMMAR